MHCVISYILLSSQVVLRQKLEDELRHKMYQRANLDKHLAQLNKIKEEFATTRKAVSRQIHGDVY